MKSETFGRTQFPAGPGIPVLTGALVSIGLSLVLWVFVGVGYMLWP